MRTSYTFSGNAWAYWKIQRRRIGWILENPKSQRTAIECGSWEDGLTWVAAGKVRGGQNAPRLRVDVKRKSRLLLGNHQIVVGLQLNPFLFCAYHGIFRSGGTFVREPLMFRRWRSRLVGLVYSRQIRHLLAIGGGWWERYWENQAIRTASL